MGLASALKCASEQTESCKEFLARWPVAKANKLSTCERRAGSDVRLWMAACVSAVERLVGSGSGSFRAASVEVAFLAERLCFANLALSFLEVLILARRSNKEPPTAARRLSEFWIITTLSVSSGRCAGRGTTICCAGPLLSLLRPIVMLTINYHSLPSAGATFRATDQRAGSGPCGAPKKGPRIGLVGCDGRKLCPIFSASGF